MAGRVSNEGSSDSVTRSGARRDGHTALLSGVTSCLFGRPPQPLLRWSIFRSQTSRRSPFWLLMSRLRHLRRELGFSVLSLVSYTTSWRAQRNRQKHAVDAQKYSHRGVRTRPRAGAQRLQEFRSAAALRAHVTGQTSQRCLQRRRRARDAKPQRPKWPNSPRPTPPTTR